MKQQITIDGQNVEYSIDTRNVLTVLGTVFISKQPTYDDILHIVYLGLKRNYGYTIHQFLAAVYKGDIYASKKRGQYPFSAVRWLVYARIRQINRDFENNRKYGFS